MNDGEVLISVEQVTLSYLRREGLLRWSRHTPLRDVSLELRRGRPLGIIGPNGAGKSSLLRLIAGIHSPDSGRIRNHGARVSLLALGVGFMPNLTGRENAMLSGLLLGIGRKAMLARMDELIAFSGLGDFIDQPLSSYSAGMRARLGFSTALQADPDVLLIDEVLGVGDEAFRIKSNQVLKRMIRSEKAVALVSHALPVIQALCTETAWIADGQLKMLGETESVIEAYRESTAQAEAKPQPTAIPQGA